VVLPEITTTSSPSSSLGKLCTSNNSLELEAKAYP
jgi:hypothetical protein